MELRHIKYFIAVAEELNFTRAAARLGIGQPPLSLQIKDLEKEVGYNLFRRLSHGAELTEAGKAFYNAVRELPDRAQDAVLNARRVARGETGKLNLGITGTLALNEFVPMVIREFRRTYPDIELRLEEANSVALMDDIIDGRLDVAILRPSHSDPDELKIIKLEKEELMVAIPVNHPTKSDDGYVDLMELKDDQWILIPRVMGRSLHDSAINACNHAGFIPKIGQPAPHIASILSLVSAEFGVSIVPKSMSQLNMGGVKFLSIRPPEPFVYMAAAYKKSQPSPIALNFVKILQSYVKGG